MSRRREWTVAEDTFILANYAKFTVRELARILDCSPATLSRHIKQLQVPPPIKGPYDFTAQELMCYP